VKFIDGGIAAVSSLVWEGLKMIKMEILIPVNNSELPGYLPWKENAELVVTVWHFLKCF